MKIANAPCSWGILEFGFEGKTDNYEKVLDEMVQTGYVGTELGDWGFMPTDPTNLKKELNDRNMSLVGAFVPVNFVNAEDHEKAKKDALKIARLLSSVDKSNSKIVLSDDNGKNKTRTRLAGRIQPQHGLSSSQWKTFSSGVDVIAKYVFDETGIKSVFHHHCAGFIETHQEIETLLNQTDPEIVSLCFDTGHYAFGGGNPVQGIKDFSQRIEHVHFKDWDRAIFREAEKNNLDYFESVGKGIFCELGKGSINFETVLNELKNQNYTDWIVVEQDILPGMGSPKESARRNREFLNSIGL